MAITLWWIGLTYSQQLLRRCIKLPPQGTVTTITSGGSLSGPHGLAIDGSGNYIVADSRTGIIRVTPSGTQTVVMAVNPAAGLTRPSDVRVDSSGNYIIADLMAAVVSVTPLGVLTDVHRGSPFSSYSGATKIGGPRGIVIDSNGDYYIVDEATPAIFRITPGSPATVTTVFNGTPLCEPADLTIASSAVGSATAIPTLAKLGTIMLAVILLLFGVCVVYRNRGLQGNGRTVPVHGTIFQTRRAESILPGIAPGAF